jgi:hypothetical protein
MCPPPDCGLITPSQSPRCLTTRNVVGDPNCVRRPILASGRPPGVKRIVVRWRRNPTSAPCCAGVRPLVPTPDADPDPDEPDPADPDPDVPDPAEPDPDEPDPDEPDPDEPGPVVPEPDPDEPCPCSAPDPPSDVAPVASSPSDLNWESAAFAVYVWVLPGEIATPTAIGLATTTGAPTAATIDQRNLRDPRAFPDGSFKVPTFERLVTRG